ncbi:MAG: CCC motif membrane protein [Bacteroidales bacterium]
MSDPNVNTPSHQIPLPNATAVLVLGISSIVLCCCYGIIGLVIAIIGLVLANRDLALYYANPEGYKQGSVSNVKNGRTMAIIGLVLAAVFIFMLFLSFLFIGLNFAMFPYELLEEFSY